MILDTNLLVEIGGWPALREARSLVEHGKVSDVHREGDVIRARVQGPGKSYEAQLTLGQRVSQVEARCTCVESHRSGRVCAHALAAGWALLHPPSAPKKSSAIAAPTPAAAGNQKQPTGPKRWSREEAPPGLPAIVCSVLLPLQLGEALRQPSLRIILEARNERETESRPWEAAAPKSDFTVGEEDALLLDALEKLSSEIRGVNSVPREKAGSFLRALAGHPRVWLGKKQQIEIKSGGQRPIIRIQRRADGALELHADAFAAAGPSIGLPGWQFDGKLLLETATLPGNFAGGTRIVPRGQIPDFLAGELPRLERDFEIAFPAGFAEFILETARPAIEAHLEGALSGLTLNLAANYGDRSFPISGTPAAATYFPDPQRPERFWRRNLRAESIAIQQAEAAGFRPARGGASTYSLIQENQVARFLANVAPRWRREWTVVFGPRLQSAMEQIDIAQPEFSLRSGSGENWLSLDLSLSVNGQPVPLDPAEIQRWLQTGQSHARQKNQRVLLVPTEAWSEMREILADCAVEQEPGQMKIAKTYAPYLSGALAANGFHGRTVEPSAPPNVQEKLDPKLWAQLRPYQAQGVEWLAMLAQQKASGLLADDMGLGKTIQALALAAWLRAAQNQTGPILVVCPTSLVTNWLREAARFVPHLRAIDLTGSDRSTRLAQAKDFDLLVTSYAILRRDAEQYRALDLSLVILDEAQHIKNRGSQNAQAAKALRSAHRLVLTGTPLENSILDLWSLFDFLLPGYLGPAAEFRERYETPLARGVDPRAMERLRHRVRPFFLRRTKEEVLTELPPKLEYPTLCTLSDEQREVYRAILAQGRSEVFDRAGKAGPGRDRIAVLTTLLRLRQVCCHLDLLPSGETKRAWREPSAKLDRTFELIDEAIDGGHRVLLFSQFVRVLHLLRDEARRREIPFAYLDGQTVERQAEVDRFQNDPAVPLFLISLKAGGTGLNLTGADTVIHFDPWWNPAVEEQATARAHRLGQARQVQAYKLIAAGTVEEKIQALQARKKELFQASLGTDEAFVEGLTGDELEELLSE